MFNFDERAVFAVNKLNENGFPSFFVGGCVRDAILGKDIYDYDVTTKATPSEIIDIFSQYTVITTGIKHGTVTLVYDKLNIEITTFRTDGAYTDNRHPDYIKFSNTLNEDLIRRDFTINTVACDKEGKLIDIFGGIEDINNGIIKCVGNPDVRFKEDALRILRALRFSSCLSFEIEKQTEISVIKNRELLKNISFERICKEFFKMILGNDFAAVCKKYSEIFACIFKGFKIPENIDIITGFPDDFVLRTAFLFEKSDLRDEYLDILKTDNFTKNEIKTIWKICDTKKDDGKISIKILLNKYGIDAFKNFLKYTDSLGYNTDNYKKNFNIISDNNECYSFKQLAVNGNDLSEIGIKGKKVGIILNILLDEVIYEREENKKDSLLKYIEEALGNIIRF